ncbi:hypothetical protein [Demetria terragena]|uniref:hypothetical protein n=1 Tax=Demetria terragena TaxID=63959 RepID=UPI0012EA2A5A|nr:hypothetical protein [Demetria terragena]
MTSNLACIGMAVTSTAGLDALIAELTSRDREFLRESFGVQTYAWQDPSGARVVYDVLAGTPHIVPTFAGTSEFDYVSIVPVSTEVTKIMVTSSDGIGHTGVTCQVEQRRHLSDVPSNGRICLTALGTHISVHADIGAFLASDASLLGTEDELGPPPAQVRDRGLAWPPRMSSKAFLANGFYGPAKPTPYALMSGVVSQVEPRTNELTGGRFLATQVRTAIGDLDLCLAGDDYDDVTPGNVIAGTVTVVGSLVAPEIAGRPRPGESRRAWRRRTGRE